MEKKKKLPQKIRYPARLSFIIEGEIQSFPKKHKLQKFMTTKTALQEISKRLFESKDVTKITKRRKDQRKYPETMTKQVIKLH